MTADGESTAQRSAIVQIDGDWFQLKGAVRCIETHELSEVARVIGIGEEAAERDGHVAGFVAYEAAKAFGLACHEPVEGLPLASFVVFETRERYDPHELLDAAARAPNLDWHASVAGKPYAAAVRRVREQLAAGQTYQVNLTFQLEARMEGDAFALFARLARAQRSSCAAYLDFGRFAICSASPEVFLSRDGDRVMMRPMKGTSARGRTPAEDRRRAAALRRSPKERAENLMIVDMVRNDLGRIAAPGSVCVPELFRVERFPTILQMTSTVEARTGARMEDIFAATFPCASVTGAPKVRTAELIREIEPGPRGVYTGAVGYMGPGGTARFNVAIRTATVDRLRNRVTYGIGSGITWDSRAGREYAECLAKARVLEADVRPFSLIETLKWDPQAGFVLLDQHLRRLRESARFFAIPYDQKRIEESLACVAAGTEPLRVRLFVDEDGRLTLESVPLQASAAGVVRVGLAGEAIDPGDVFLYHKTTRRGVYERAKASRPDCDQVILWNAHGRVTETDIANLAVRRDGRWVTPPVRDGLLAGTQRQDLLVQGVIQEGHVTVEDLREGCQIAVFNSVRGWQEAVFVEAQDGVRAIAASGRRRRRHHRPGGRRR